ncbi:hypothetical protein [Leptospira bouyouniensis]|uniref:DUF3098 domain-containing protein n=1 Tax=Leptospira bouyouniensis TaxID=2484911 RepID=A0ABY2L990_9LEPT|nr:hypothetical protein [Leptospira bouyouniensis]TGK53235.1 hypothetical protein EHQ10_05700 [Leptospira bouyouniensis]
MKSKLTLENKRLWITGLVIFILGNGLEIFFLLNNISTTVSGLGFNFPGFFGLGLFGLLMFIAPFVSIAYNKYKEVPVPLDPAPDTTDPSPCIPKKKKSQKRNKRGKRNEY